VPELPDVEALRRFLCSLGVEGRRVVRVDLLWPRAVRHPDPDAFVRGLAGQRLASLGRRAKFLLFRLGDGRTWAVHLRMTGTLAVAPSDRPYGPYVRNAFPLDDGRALWFVDPRKLGQMWLLEDPAPLLAGLGPEPLDEDLRPHPAFTPAVLAEALGQRRAPLKAVLMDPQAVAGIGNIYADEVLFWAGLHPLRPARSLTPAEVERLHTAMGEVLARAVRLLGERVVGRVEGPLTESAEGQRLLRVPRREGTPCTRCGTPVQRVRIGGRSAFFCPACQPSP